MAPRQLTIAQRDMFISCVAIAALLAGLLVYFVLPKPKDYFEFHHMTEGSYFKVFASAAECDAQAEGFRLSGRSDGFTFCNKVSEASSIDAGIRNVPSKLPVQTSGYIRDGRHPDSAQISDSAEEGKGNCGQGCFTIVINPPAATPGHPLPHKKEIPTPKPRPSDWTGKSSVEVFRCPAGKDCVKTWQAVPYVSQH